MYTTAHFKESDTARISALIEDYPFATLITAPEGLPYVSHLPFLFEPTAGAKGRLLGHMARANPQWRHFPAADGVLALFQGPHAYISPAWYASPGVPTWNYAVVHIRGSARLIDDDSALEALLERMTHVHESHMPNPWSPSLSAGRRSTLLKMIVGFSIDITEIQAKFKLSQNRPIEDRQRVVAALNRSPNQTENALARLMSVADNGEHLT
jgi:transcriptional regulator